jgi:hypothetical protein
VCTSGEQQDTEASAGKPRPVEVLVSARDTKGGHGVPQHEGSTLHEWIAAAEVPIEGKHVRRALLRQSFRTTTDLKVAVLDVYCRNCRRNFKDVAGQKCICKETTRHLRGGPDGRRRRAPVPVPVAVIVTVDDLPATDYQPPPDEAAAATG